MDFCPWIKYAEHEIETDVGSRQSRQNQLVSYEGALWMGHKDGYLYQVGERARTMWKSERSLISTCDKIITEGENMWALFKRYNRSSELIQYRKGEFYRIFDDSSIYDMCYGGGYLWCGGRSPSGLYQYTVDGDLVAKEKYCVQEMFWFDNMLYVWNKCMKIVSISVKDRFTFTTTDLRIFGCNSTISIDDNLYITYPNEIHHYRAGQSINIFKIHDVHEFGKPNITYRVYALNNQLWRISDQTIHVHDPNSLEYTYHSRLPFAGLWKICHHNNSLYAVSNCGDIYQHITLGKGDKQLLLSMSVFQRKCFILVRKFLDKHFGKDIRNQILNLM